MKRNLWMALLAAAALCALLCAGAGAEVLELPEKLEVIEAEAFYGDTGFTEVVFPPSLRVIGPRAFMNSSLLEADIPASVTEIGEDAFTGLPEAAVITVYEGSAAEAYFAGLDTAFTVRVAEPPDTRIYWDEYEFSWYTISGESNKVEIWIKGLKEGSTLTGLKFNKSYYDWEIERMIINYHAFENCTQLTEAPQFPSYLTEIRESAFDGCTQMSGELVLPDGLQVLGKYAFRGCASLTGLRLPSGMEEINYGVFRGCRGLSGTLALPASLKTIRANAFGCSDPVDGIYPDDAPGFTSVLLPDGLEIIEGSAFQGCKALRGSLSIPDSVTKIEGSAFRDCGFDGTLRLSNSLTVIGGGAFEGCHFIGDLWIPDSVTEIQGDAFGYFEQVNDSGVLVGITGPGQFTGNLHLGSGVKEIWDGAFGGCGFTGSLVIPDSVTWIGSGAFAGLADMKGTLKIGNNTETIGSYAFYRSAFSGSVTIPDSVTRLSEYAFMDCTGLNGTLTIGSNALAHEPSIMDGQLAAHVNTFKGCTNLHTVMIEEGAVTIPGYAFEDCTSLTTVELPSTLKYIETCAFFNCTSLANLRNTESLYWLWPAVFRNCTSLNGILDLRGLRQDSLSSSQFQYCSSLRGVILGEWAFNEWDLIRSGTHTTYDPFLGTSPYFTVYCPSADSTTGKAAAAAGYRWSVSGQGSIFGGLPSGEIEQGERFTFRGVYREEQEIANLRAVLKDAEGTVLAETVVPVGSEYVLFSSLNEAIRIEELDLGDYALTVEMSSAGSPSNYWAFAVSGFKIIPSAQKVWTDRADDLPRGLLVKGEVFETQAVLYANREIADIHVQLTRDETNVWDYALDVGARQIPMADVLANLELASRNAGTYQLEVQVRLSGDDSAYTRSSEFTIFELDGTLDEDLAKSIVRWSQDPANRNVFDESESHSFMKKISDLDAMAIILCNYSDIDKDVLEDLFDGQEGCTYIKKIYKEAIYDMVKDLAEHVPDIASASDVLPLGSYITDELKDFKSASKHTVDQVQDAYDSYSRYMQRRYDASKENADFAEKYFFKEELAYLKELKEATKGLGTFLKVYSFSKDVTDIFIRAQLDFHNGLYVLSTLRDAFGENAPVEFMNALEEVMDEYSSREATYLAGAVDLLKEKILDKADEVIQDGVLTITGRVLGESVSSITLTFGVVKFVLDEGIAPLAKNTSDRASKFMSAYNLLNRCRKVYHEAFDDVCQDGGLQTSERLNKLYASFLATRHAIDKCYEAMVNWAEDDGDSALAAALEEQRKGFIRLSIN